MRQDFSRHFCRSMAISCGAFPEGLGLGDVETVSDLNLRCVRSELGVWRGQVADRVGYRVDENIVRHSEITKTGADRS